VFVDIDEQTLNMDLEKLRGAITDRTRAILAVNLLGNPNDFDAIKAAIAGRNIVLLEDNCESMGATFGGKQAGTHGLMGTFSSFFSHHISTMEGGCVVTDDDELHHILLCLRAHGWTRNLPKENHVTGVKSDDPFEESYKFVLPGYNVRPLEMSGAIGIEQLKKLPNFIKTRRDNAAIFVEMFSNHPFLRIQREVGQSSWFGFSFIVDEQSGVSRADCLRKLAHHGIEYRPIVSGNFVKNSVIEYFDYRVAGDVSAAEKLDKSGFFVGNHHIDLRQELELLGRALAP
jgi:CDP-6-deoxy-D-xylo-4-hexulose-3-dehydrase